MKKIDLTGQRFGRLCVIADAGRDGRGERLWRCKCDCGNEMIALSSNLRTKHTTSCGCYRLENVKVINKTHGLAGTKIYNVWCAMKRRCTLKNCGDFSNYGGRGIKVCDEWANDFNEFCIWAMRNGYSDGMTIDRIDTNGDYEPSNCRWVTLTEQANNKRNNHLIAYNGETHTMKEWSRILGINYYTLNNRLRNGWSIERAFGYDDTNTDTETN